MNSQLNRRGFIVKSGAALLATSLSASAGIAASGATGGSPIGLQLYTLRKRIAEDMGATLATVADIGYREVEFAGYFDQPLGAIRTMLANNGLSAPSAHMRIADLEQNFDRLLGAAVELGHRYLVLAWLPPEDRTLQRYKEIADLLNRNGDKARQAGVHLAYHNHEFEFFDVDGQVPYEILLQETDPALVKFEMDIYWFAVAKQDPLKMIDRFPGRFPAIHVKDMDANGNIVDVGQGVLDFSPLYKRREKAGLKHFFVEHDNTADPQKTIEESFSAFSRVIAGTA